MSWVIPVHVRSAGNQSHSRLLGQLKVEVPARSNGKGCGSLQSSATNRYLPRSQTADPNPQPALQRDNAAHQRCGLLRILQF